MKRSLLVLALAALSVSAHAEMYRYRDPETGRMKLTNIPPKPATPTPSGAAGGEPGPTTRPPGAAQPIGHSAPPPGRSTRAGSLFELSAPGLAWSVAIPRHDWAVQNEKRRADGGRYYFVTSETKPTPFSIYFDRTADCASGEACRARYWRNRPPDFRDARDVRMYERNGFHVVQFWVDLGIKQANVSAHMYRDGYWIDLRISRVDRQVPDPAPLLELLDSVVVK